LHNWKELEFHKLLELFQAFQTNIGIIEKLPVIFQKNLKFSNIMELYFSSHVEISSRFPEIFSNFENSMQN